MQTFIQYKIEKTHQDSASWSLIAKQVQQEKARATERKQNKGGDSEIKQDKAR